MDSLDSEVSAKIRDAIKAKLVELDAYVDNELPDYIMVMVVNGKNGQQMKEDLGLFLNEHTNAFVDWLVNVLDKLKKVTMGDDKDVKKRLKKKTKEKKKKDKKEKKKPLTLDKKKSDSEFEDAHLLDSSAESDAPPASKEPLTKKQETKTSRSRTRSPRRRLPSRSRSRERKRPTPREQPAKSKSPMRRDRSPHRSRRRSPEHIRRETGTDFTPRSGPSRKERSRESHNRNKARPSATTSEVRSSAPVLSSSVGAVISNDSDGEYNPEAMLKRSLLASSVSAPKRPTNRGPEPSKNLVLRAVADADRSIVRRQHEELESVHKKRMALSQAMREGALSKKKINDINNDLVAAKQNREKREKKARKEEKKEQKKEQKKNKKRKKEAAALLIDIMAKKMAADKHEEDQRKRLRAKKKEAAKQASPTVVHSLQPAAPSREQQKVQLKVRLEDDDDDLSDLDLRHTLATNRNRSLEALRNSGLTICVPNDYRVKKSKKRRSSPSPEKTVEEYSPKQVAGASTYDPSSTKVVLEEYSPKPVGAYEPSHPAFLEEDSPRVELEEPELEEEEEEIDAEEEDVIELDESYLQEMRQQALDSMLERRKSSDEKPKPASAYKESAKKIIIPLGDDDTSDEDYEPQQKSHPSDMSNERSGDPTFIVTLQGISKEYFKSSSATKKADPVVAPVPSVAIKKALAPKTATVAAQKPTAPIRGRTRITPPSPEAKPAIVVQRKPEAKVAPLPKANAAGKYTRPSSAGSSSSVSTSEQPKRKRITAPEADHATPKVITSYTPLASKPQQGGQTICKYYPRCTRGDACFYLHPKATCWSRGAPKAAMTAKYKWTAH